ncbi:TIGR02099 family protein [Microbulbifer salipaludis]|uniref:TIGR02099 family protein n=1 Tax=Microbulbifer salipaludis TaxID=187980 RepID=A0ABS3EAI8_9GAMM|nr:YhdP family protein [Microbulbifer salipaludis]MBN8432322.1 TIGR02099 family protein [Microbulbifer salipaludis]
MLWLRWFARKFWLLVVILVISLAILVQTGRILSPQVGKYSPEIGHWLSARLGAPVQLEHIALRWQALEVALQIDGLNIGDSGQVKLARGLFHLDLLASLWNRELIWKNLEVDGFSAQLEQRAEGGWQVQGFPRVGAPADAGVAPGDAGLRLGDPARIFQLGPKVLVRDASIGLTLTDGQSANLELREIQLENSGVFHRLVARAFVTGAMESLHSGEESLRLVLEGRGNPRDHDEFSLKGYVQLNELLVDADLVALVYQLLPLPEKLYWPGRKLAGGRLWLSSDAKNGYSLRGDLSLAQVADDGQGAVEGEHDADAGRALETLNALSSKLSGRWRPGDSWELVLQDLGLNWQQLEVPDVNLQASGDQSGNLQLAVDQIELQAWHRVLKVLELIPEKADEWLNALDPTGELQNVRLARVDGELTLAANLHDVVAGAHRGAPAVSGVNGYLFLNGQGGRVELASNEGFSAHFPVLYDAPFEFGSARGTVAWDVDRAHNTISIYSGPIQLDAITDEQPGRPSTGGAPAAAFSGQFLLQIPVVPHTRAADFTLALGLRNVAVQEQRHLVPTVVSDDLRRWLDQSIGKRNAGRIPAAGLIYRGYSYREGEDQDLLALGAHDFRNTVQLQADIRDSSLAYAPDWPVAEHVDGHLGINDREVLVVAPSAKLWDVSGANVSVRISPEPTGSRLDVRAELAGPAADGLKILRESPLRERLGTAFDSWDLGGTMQGTLQLSQPLGGADFAPSQQVDVALSDAHLTLQNLNLDIHGLDGNVRYHSSDGLKGSRFRGRLWGKPLRASIAHLGQGEDRDTQVVVHGEAVTESIGQWSGRPELQWLDGALDYTARVTIPAQAKEKPYAAVLELSSDLEQVAVQLPAPLAKPAGEKSRFVLRVPIGAQGNLYHLSYGEHLQGQIWQVDGKLERAAIALNAEATLPASPGIAVMGHLPVVDLPPWQEALSIYTDAAPAIADGPAAVAVTDGATAAASDENPLPIRLDLSTDLLQVSETTRIDNIHVRGRGLGADWLLDFDSETAAGKLSGTLNSATPMQLALEHLRLPPLAAKEGSAVGDSDTEAPASLAARLQDRWKGFDFASLPSVDFSTETLWMGDESMGPWSFQLRPSAQRLVVSDIEGTLRGIRIEGRTTGDSRLGAQLMWMRDDDGSESSQFIGRLRGENLGQVLQSWGQEAAIESRSAVFDTALRWQGSPAMLSPQSLNGEIRIDIRNGRFMRASDNAGTSLLRLLSLFNFDTWARRLRLDFSDLVQSGLTFDRVHGEVYFEGDGELLIAVPIQVEGPTSELQMAGRVNLQREDLNLTLVATLPVGNNLAFVAALAGGLPAAAGVYLISKVFKKQVDRVASVSYRINGEWADPEVRFDKLFDDGAAGREGRSAVAQRHKEKAAREAATRAASAGVAAPEQGVQQGSGGLPVEAPGSQRPQPLGAG